MLHAIIQKPDHPQRVFCEALRDVGVAMRDELKKAKQAARSATVLPEKAAINKALAAIVAVTPAALATEANIPRQRLHNAGALVGKNEQHRLGPDAMRALAVAMYRAARHLSHAGADLEDAADSALPLKRRGKP